MAAAAPRTPADLAAYLQKCCTPRSQWRVGIEHEKFAYRLEDLRPAPLRGREASIQALLRRLVARGWRPDYHGAELVGARSGACAVALEPGGQVEFAGAPHGDLTSLAEEFSLHNARLVYEARATGLGLLATGFAPEWARDDMPRVPSQRFDIMARHMDRVGSHGRDMMRRTCSLQASFDYDSEADMVGKLRVGLGLAPVVTALTANSPFADGAPSGWCSFRERVWADTDPARCGMPAFVFQPDMGFERYAQWACAVPVYSVIRQGEHIDLTHRTLADLLAGAEAATLGAVTEEDFALQLNALSPEARLKRVIEIRGADSVSEPLCLAVTALWTGLMYDPAALATCHRLVMAWTDEARGALWHDAAREGLRARVEGRPLLEVARQVVTLARQGLERWDAAGARFLEPLERLVEAGVTPAERWLDRYAGPWHGRLEPLYRSAGL